MDQQWWLMARWGAMRHGWVVAAEGEGEIHRDWGVGTTDEEMEGHEIWGGNGG